MSTVIFKKTIVCSLLFFVLGTIFLFSLNAYPVVGGDSIYYVPTAINHKLGLGLTNHLSPMFIVGDPTGEGKFLVFPPLYPLILSWLMIDANASGAYMAFFVIYAVTILLAGLAYVKLLIPNFQEASWYRIVLFGFSLFSLASVTIFYPGRPETLMRLIVVLMLFLLLYTFNKKWLWLYLGSIVGLGAATHPGSAIFLPSIAGIFLAFFNRTKEILKPMVLTAGFAVLIFFLITQFLGNGFLPTITGVSNQFLRLSTGLMPEEYIKAGSVPATTRSPVFTKDHFARLISITTFSRAAAFQGFLMSFFFVNLFILYRYFKNKIASPPLFYLFALLNLITIFYILIYKLSIAYMLAFAPLYIIVVAHCAANISNSKLFKLTALAIVALSSFMFFYRLALFPFFVNSGVSLEQARKIFNELPEARNRIGVDSTIWLLSENYDQMYLWGDVEDVEYPTSTIVMREGLNGWAELPTKWSYCNKVRDFFTHQRPAILNVYLSQTLQSYAFGVYDCRDRSLTPEF